MDKLFLERKSRYKNLLLILLPLVLIACILAYFSYVSAKNAFNIDDQTVVPSNVIEKYHYQLRGNATDYQKELFEELKYDFEHEDETDELKVAEDIAKNYVADFYTWTNKQGRFDVGGMCYVNGYYKYNNWMQATDNFYKYITNYINEYGADDLIEVENIEVVDSFRKEDYTIGEDSYYKSFHVILKWNYKETKRFDTSKFTNNLNITVVKEPYGNLTIAEVYEIGD